MITERFLCDAMLGGLARWLRAAGYDAILAGPGVRDRDLVAQAVREGRRLLTRDRNMMQVRAADQVVLVLEGNGIDAWMGELAVRLGLDWMSAPLSRCLVCNRVLEEAPEALRAAVPESSRACPGPLRRCPACGRLYWQGSHATRMLHRLALAGKP